MLSHARGSRAGGFDDQPPRFSGVRHVGAVLGGPGGGGYRAMHVGIAVWHPGSSMRQGRDCLQVARAAAERAAGDERRPVDHRSERGQQGMAGRLR